MECYLVDPNADVLGGVLEQETCKEIIEKMALSCLPKMEDSSVNL